MSDIFLSYNEKDRETVRRLADIFKSVGWSVWWDRRIPAGGTWRTLLEAELQAMRCMVVVWSANSIKSDWVHEEATEGRTAGRLVPVSIEAVRPPPGFREIQSADLVGWDGTTTWPNMRTLIADIESLIGRPVEATPVAIVAATGQSADASPEVATRSRPTEPSSGTMDRAAPRLMGRRSVAVVAAVVMAVASAAYFAFHRPGPEKGADSSTTGTTLVAHADPMVPSISSEPQVVTPITGPKPTEATPTTGSRPETTALVTPNPAKAAKTSRCADLLQREALGERLSPAEVDYQKKGCRK